TRSLIVELPSPSHPTVRSVCPRTAVRQSSSHTRRRFRRGLAQAAAHVDEPQRLPPAVRKAFPSATPALASLGHGPAKTEGDETLEPSERWAGVGVPAGVGPPRHPGMHHLEELLRAARRSARRHRLQAVPHGLLGGLGWEQVDGLVAAPGTLAFHTVATEDSKPLGHPCHAGLGAV